MLFNRHKFQGKVTAVKTKLNNPKVIQLDFSLIQDRVKEMIITKTITQEVLFMNYIAETKVAGNYFEPVIIAYCCKWCSYAAADLAGNMRIQYPANIRIVRVSCTGRIDILHLLKSFEFGADGVFISGCLPGDCHYLNGNDKAQKRVNFVKKILEEIGIKPERIEMFHNSAAMGPQFARTCIDFNDRLTELGPLHDRA